MTELEDVGHALVIGLGISGQAAADCLLRAGVRVTVNDISTAGTVAAAAEELRGMGAGVVLGHHRLELLEGVDLVVVSPGVKSRLPLLAEAERRGITVWSEIELAWRRARGPVVAVTGTNGKTTTVSMIAWVLKSCGREALAAGNIGHPLVKAVDEVGEDAVLVVEVSSFQLAYTEKFRPRVAVLLNLAEDHFDWHEDMEEYVAAKTRIWMGQGPGDLAVCNLDDPACVEAARSAPASVAYFSCRPHDAASVFLREGTMVARGSPGSRAAGGEREIMRAADLPLPGEHNLENAMAAAATALFLGLQPYEVGEALRGFEGLDHRLQLVGEAEGIAYYDDSKATNPHAAMCALSAFDRPLVLILGGRNKGLGFDDLAREIELRRDAGRIRAVYLIGEAAQEINETLERLSPRLVRKVLPGLEEVFADLGKVARRGDVVLFSPACASFDRYKDYRERGRHFQQMVDKHLSPGGGYG